MASLLNHRASVVHTRLCRIQRAVLALQERLVQPRLSGCMACVGGWGLGARTQGAMHGESRQGSEPGHGCRQPMQSEHTKGSWLQ